MAWLAPIYVCKGNYSAEYDDIGEWDETNTYLRGCNATYDDGTGRIGSPGNRTLRNITDASLDLGQLMSVPLDSAYFYGAVCAVGSHASGTSTLCPSDATQIDGFFSKTNYIGAFAPGSDEDNNWAAGWTKGLFTAPECPAGTFESEQLEGKKVCSVQGSVFRPFCVIATVLNSGENTFVIIQIL